MEKEEEEEKEEEKKEEEEEEKDSIFSMISTLHMYQCSIPQALYERTWHII